MKEKFIKQGALAIVSEKMSAIDTVVSNLPREKYHQDSSLNTKELCKNSLFRLDYYGKIRYNYNEDRGEIAMRKPETGPSP